MTGRAPTTRHIRVGAPRDRQRAPPTACRRCSASCAIRSGSAGPRSRAARAASSPRTQTADRVVQSVCPYCAVGCGQRVYVKDEQVIQIEGDPD